MRLNGRLVSFDFKTDKKDARLWGQFRNNMILEYSINDSLLMIEASLPDKLVRGQVFDMPVKIINRSDNIRNYS